MASFINKNSCRYWLLVFSLQSLVTYSQTFSERLSKAAVELTLQSVTYDPSYYRIDYPNGDVPSNKGVCTDVVIRAYRKLGIDLQKEVHEDMTKNFSLYPKIWGLSKTDKNIDHRRVPNLMTFFGRYGTVKSKSTDPTSYSSGDIVAWDLGGGTTHIGILITQRSPDGERPLVVHNIGRGQEISDCLFDFKIIGHYCYSK
ncbi:MAG: DUF1287 domain-containing protein [Cyclobacteriaceae bacterium]|nr:DUF1287 domain-containing protein [Cyclobacteriaceae bacterium]